MKNKTISNNKKVVIIGCSGNGAHAAIMTKRLEPSADVTIVREEEHLLVRCAVPYIIAGEVTLESCYKSDDMFTNAGIKLIDSKATGIDRVNKTVATENGGVYPYDKLVLATGGIPIKPKIPGSDISGVFTTRTGLDALAIQDWMKSNSIRSAVVIGASAVGLEVATAISRTGVAVTTIEMLAHVLPIATDTDISQEVERHLIDKGISLRMNQTAARILGNGKVTGVELASGEKIDTEMVILAIGVRPRWELAEAAGLEKGRFGLKVNQYLQTSDPNIYAGGDLIEYKNFITGKPTAGQLRPNAVMTGRLIAKNILGYDAELPGVLNTFVTKLADISLASTGITEKAAQQEEMEIIIAKRSAESKHSMIEGKELYTIKLLFERKTQKIIGGQMVGYSECAVRHIDVIAVAIKCGLTINELTTMACAGQPELSPDPGTAPIALVAEDAFLQLINVT